MDNLKETFDEQGYVILRDFWEPEVLRSVRGEMEHFVEQKAQALLAAGKIEDTLADEPFETRLLRLYEDDPDEAPGTLRRELHLTGLFPLFFHARLLDVVERFLGSEIRIYPNYSIRPKFPEQARIRVLWHQDGGYTVGVAGPSGASDVVTMRMVNVWTPLVPANVENGCMQFIPGTHKLGNAPHRDLGDQLEIDPAYIESLLAQAIPIELAPGDLVLFHNLLFHQGLPNLSQTVRWSVDWRYQDATQPTLRKEHGHLARSRRQPERVVKSAQEWASLSFQ